MRHCNAQAQKPYAIYPNSSTSVWYNCGNQHHCKLPTGLPLSTTPGLSSGVHTSVYTGTHIKFIFFLHVTWEIKLLWKWKKCDDTQDIYWLSSFQKPPPYQWLDHLDRSYWGWGILLIKCPSLFNRIIITFTYLLEFE